MPESLVRYIPDQAFAEVGSDRFGSRDFVGIHRVAQVFEDAHASFEATTRRGILGYAVCIILLGPVDDSVARISEKRGSLQVAAPSQVVPILKAGDDIGVDAVGIFMNIEGFVASRNVVRTQI